MPGRKAVEQMSRLELVDLVRWYRNRIAYCEFLLERLPVDSAVSGDDAPIGNVSGS